MLNTLKEVCGKKKLNQDHKKRTLWWNNNVKEAIQTKKTLFQIWVKSKAQVDYKAYKIARKLAKHMIRTAKEEVWKNYGEQLATIRKERPRDFLKSINAMRVRDEPFNPMTVINNKNITPIFNPNEKKGDGKNTSRSYSTQLMPRVTTYIDPPTAEKKNQAY
jgi:tRNA G18 (ribose-2'-O)-methylase SpoU